MDPISFVNSLDIIISVKGIVFLVIVSALSCWFRLMRPVVLSGSHGAEVSFC